MSVSLNGTNGLTFADSTTQNTGGYTGFRNRIINGDMRIDQRNAGASVNASSANSPYVPDRFYVSVGGSSAVIAGQQVSDAPASFVNSLKLTASTAATPTSGQYVFCRQIIEGVNIADLGWGTASAQTVTASFWVKASITGAYAVFFINNAEDRSYLSTVTVNSANTWEFKTVTVPGDTTGTWLTNNSNGIRFGVDLGSGSNLQGTANAWQSGWKQRTAGTVNFCQNTGATFQITGVQLEAGSVATPFERRPYGTELALCERYYEVGQEEFSMAAGPNGVCNIPAHFRQKKRSQPTITATNSFFVGGGTTVDGVSLWKSGSQSTSVAWTASSEL